MPLNSCCVSRSQGALEKDLDKFTFVSREASLFIILYSCSTDTTRSMEMVEAKWLPQITKTQVLPW